MPIRGVILDMGGTLLHYNAPGATWEDTEKTGAKAIYRHLTRRGYALPPEQDALDMAWQHALSVWTALDSYDVRKLTLRHQIGVVIARWGLKDVDDPTIDNLVQDYMAAIQAHVYPLDGATDTLKMLRDNGLRIGLISNTLWPGYAHTDDLDRYALTPYLEHMIFSADAYAWKPHKRVFQLGLDALGLDASEAVYVGDSLYFDVWGAQQAGLRAIWLEQKYRWLPDGIEVTPDATIQHLPELVDIISTWQ